MSGSAVEGVGRRSAPRVVVGASSPVVVVVGAAELTRTVRVVAGSTIVVEGTSGGLTVLTVVDVTNAVVLGCSEVVAGERAVTGEAANRGGGGLSPADHAATAELTASARASRSHDRLDFSGTPSSIARTAR